MGSVELFIIYRALSCYYVLRPSIPSYEGIFRCYQSTCKYEFIDLYYQSYTNLYGFNDDSFKDKELEALCQLQAW